MLHVCARVRDAFIRAVPCSYYFNAKTMACLKSVDAPYLVKSGYNPHAPRHHRDWTMTLYWRHVHKLVPDWMTADGAVAMSDEERAAAGERCNVAAHGMYLGSS